MATPTVVTTSTEERSAEVEKASFGSAATWWYDWVDARRVGAAALVGVIATQLGTYFGYVFPAIGLPTLPWPLYNGLLATPAEEFGTAASFFPGQSLHYINGIVFALLAEPGLPKSVSNVLWPWTLAVCRTWRCKIAFARIARRSSNAVG